MSDGKTTENWDYCKELIKTRIQHLKLTYTEISSAESYAFMRGYTGGEIHGLRTCLTIMEELEK